MTEKAMELANVENTDRKNIYFKMAKLFCLYGYKYLATPKIDFQADLHEYKKRNPPAVFLYAGLHKSLWETSGILPSLYYEKLPLPLVGMGDNLVRGRFFQNVGKKVGTFLIKRAKTPREMVESARRFKDDVVGYMARGIDILVYPEGTRKNVVEKGHYGDFFPTVFEGLLEYEKVKPDLLQAHPHLTPWDTYVVPFNVDYFRVREADEMVRQRGGKPRTLHVFDSVSMITHIGPVFATFGRPIRIADHLEKNRKEMAAFVRQACLDLVCILPVNVAARAALRFPPEAAISEEKLLEAIRREVSALAPHNARFRAFTPTTPEREILRQARRSHLDFLRHDADTHAIYKLYADYIGHIG